MVMKIKTRDFFSVIFPVLLWMLFIFILSSVKGESIPKFPIPHFHMLVHFGEYSMLGFLFLRAFIYLRPQAGGLALLSISALFCLLFALSDEWHQSFVAGRTSQLVTVGYDMIFYILGLGAYGLTGMKQRKRITP